MVRAAVPSPFLGAMVAKYGTERAENRGSPPTDKTSGEWREEVLERTLVGDARLPADLHRVER